MTKRRDVSAFLAQLWGLEDTLVQAGFPAMPEWWRREITRFYRSGRLRWVVRKGRRVYASTCVAPRLAVAEMLYGEHPHLKGTPPIVFAFLSVKKGEAANRLRGVRAILEALDLAEGEDFRESGDTIELLKRPALFAVVTANFRTSVGETVAFAWCDELARWRDDASGANPAEQVIASLTPALSTLPDAKLFLVSTPLALDDYHAKAFDLGDTAGQLVSFGASWDINPTLTREKAEELEPDPKLRAREYGGIPSASTSAAFEPEHWLRCFRQPKGDLRYYAGLGTIDSAAGKRVGADQFVWASWAMAIPPDPPPYLTGMVPRLAHVSNVAKDSLPESVRHYWREGAFSYPDPNDLIPGILRDERDNPLPNPEAVRGPTPLLVMRAIDSRAGMFQRQLVDGSLWREVRRMFQTFDVRHCIGDSYSEADSKKELGMAFFTGLSWTNEDKKRWVYRLRQLMATDSLILPDHPKLKAEGLAFTEYVTDRGTITYEARGAGKDDHVSMLLNAVAGEELRKLPGSSLHEGYGKHVTSGR